MIHEKTTKCTNVFVRKISCHFVDRFSINNCQLTAWVNPLLLRTCRWRSDRHRRGRRCGW